MTFERGVCEQAKEFRVLLVMKHHAKRKCLEDGAVVTALDGVGQKSARVSHAAITCFLIEYSIVKLVLRGEVAKDHSFGDACGLSYLFCGRAAKTAVREKPHGYAQDLQAALFACHASR